MSLSYFPYQETAEVDLASITDRLAVIKAIQCGNALTIAAEKLNALNPELLSSFFIPDWLLGIKYQPCFIVNESSVMIGLGACDVCRY